MHVMIGAYAPADADLSTTVPVKYGYCDDSTTSSTGIYLAASQMMQLSASIHPFTHPTVISFTPLIHARAGSDEWDYLSSGRGLLTFNLTNLRTDVSFYFFTNGLRSPVVRYSWSNLTTKT